MKYCTIIEIVLSIFWCSLCKISPFYICAEVTYYFLVYTWTHCFTTQATAYIHILTNDSEYLGKIPKSCNRGCTYLTPVSYKCFISPCLTVMFPKKYFVTKKKQRIVQRLKVVKILVALVAALSIFNSSSTSCSGASHSSVCVYIYIYTHTHLHLSKVNNKETSTFFTRII